jgi:hypothetical protein
MKSKEMIMSARATSIPGGQRRGGAPCDVDEEKEQGKTEFVSGNHH